MSGRAGFLTSDDEKMLLLERAGIENVILLRFDEELSRMNACDFVEQVLFGRIGMKFMVVGFNHRFGAGGTGDYDEILSCAGRLGFGLERIGSMVQEEGVISSTLIREALLRGDLYAANKMLGYEYFLRGSIVEGRKLGRSIGFPTANISPESEHKLLPGDGVYLVKAGLNGKEYGGMANIGHRPTLSEPGEPKSVEVHILRFGQTIYGQSVTLTFLKRLRDEMKFPSVEALRDQLMRDRDEALRYFEGGFMA
jgi:riboflavin kinase/FMN adenylyltransferase